MKIRFMTALFLIIASTQSFAIFGSSSTQAWEPNWNDGLEKQVSDYMSLFSSEKEVRDYYQTIGSPSSIFPAREIYREMEPYDPNLPDNLEGLFWFDGALGGSSAVSSFASGGWIESNSTIKVFLGGPTWSYRKHSLFIPISYPQVLFWETYYIFNFSPDRKSAQIDWGLLGFTLFKSSDLFAFEMTQVDENKWVRESVLFPRGGPCTLFNPIFCRRILPFNNYDVLKIVDSNRNPIDEGDPNGNWERFLQTFNGGESLIIKFPNPEPTPEPTPEPEITETCFTIPIVNITFCLPVFSI